ncbi:MAG TPA: TMEM175 family protein [Streptosporangiaceae bacterium]|nr:TMEM175 family protein [Streptosporangiaceae bacterium]
MDTSRAEAFSDGVFAVAITVLVFNLLDITLRQHPYQDLASAWPSYFAYVVSFLTIGIMWMNHHTIFGHITRVDRPLLVLNLFLLLGVVAIPWPTALVAKQLRHSGGGPAAVTYGLVMILISVGFGGLWIYVVTHAARLGGQAEPEALRRSIPGFTGGLLVYVAGTLLAAFGLPVAALILYGLLAVYYLFDHLPAPQAPAEGA